MRPAHRQRLGQAIAANGASAIMLSGGTTPLPAYRALARGPLAHDDRCISCSPTIAMCRPIRTPATITSRRPLLDALALAAAAVARVRTELPLDEARRITNGSARTVEFQRGASD